MNIPCLPALPKEVGGWKPHLSMEGNSASLPLPLPHLTWSPLAPSPCVCPTPVPSLPASPHSLPHLSPGEPSLFALFFQTYLLTEGI